MVAAADPAGHGCAARNSGYLSYLRTAGIAFRPPGNWGRQPPAKPANEVITDSEATKPGDQIGSDPSSAKPANEVITDLGAQLAGGDAPPPTLQPGRSPSSSACEPYRDTIEVGL